MILLISGQNPDDNPWKLTALPGKPGGPLGPIYWLIYIFTYIYIYILNIYEICREKHTSEWPQAMNIVIANKRKSMSIYKAASICIFIYYLVIIICSTTNQGFKVYERPHTLTHSAGRDYYGMNIRRCQKKPIRNEEVRR